MPVPASPPLKRFVELTLRGRAPLPAASAKRPVAAVLLTHHQIIELCAPFTRQGQVLDMAASDRLRRSLVFRSVRTELLPTADAAAGDGDAGPRTVVETLRLDSPHAGHFRLTRTLRGDDGLQATLQADGARPADLLAAVMAVPRQRHFHAGPGYRIASSARITSYGKPDAHGARPTGCRLTAAVVQTRALTMTVSASSSTSSSVSSACVDIQARDAGMNLPGDLLSVLGWDWSLLMPAGALGWQGSVRLRNGPGSSGVMTENKLHAAAAHLARTLGEPPQCFDARWRSARFGVLVRHAMPLLACMLLALLALFADALRDARASPLTLAVMCLPAALLMFFMLRSEPPRLSLPNWPRRLAHDAWRVAS